MNHQQDTTNPAIINLMVDYLRDTYGSESTSYLWVGKFKDDGMPAGRAFTSYADAATYAHSLDVPGCKGVYHQARLTDVDHGPYSRGKAVADGWLYFYQLDVDIDGPGHKRGNGDGLNPYARTRDEARELIAALGWGEPSLIIDSGGGLYPRWTFPEPVRNTAEVREMFSALHARHVEKVWERAGRHIDNVSDAARVFRVPGTFNRKTGDEGAPMCRPVQPDNGKRYTLVELLAASDITMVQYAAPAVPVARTSAPAVGDALSLFAQPSELSSSVLFDDKRKDVWWWREELDKRVSGLVPGGFNNGLNTLALWAGKGAPGAWTLDEARTWIEDVVRTVRHEPTGEDLGTIGSGLSAGLADPFTFRPGTETRPADAPKDGEGMSIELAPSNLPESFWESRESLKLIRQAAHQWTASADAVLGGVLTRVAASVPPQIGPNTGIGATTSLNLIVALVAQSGGGKTSALGVVDELMPDDERWRPHFAQLGSGEGIAEAFMGMVDEENEETGKTKKVRRKVRDNVLMNKDEGAELVRMMEREGATVGEALRSAWSGAGLGQSNARAETTRTIDKGSYSFGLTIGFQFGIAGRLFATHEMDVGTPQRFLWLSATDPSVPDEVETFTDARLKLLSASGSPWDPVSVFVERPAIPKMTIPESVKAELRREKVAKTRGELVVDAADSHRNLLIVKVACLLSLLDGRTDAIEDDWVLARQVLATSDVIRRRIQEHSAREQETAKRARLDEARSRAKASEAGRQEQAEACMEGHIALYARKLATGSARRRDLIKSLSPKHRSAGCGEEALGQGIERGLWTETDSTFTLTT